MSLAQFHPENELEKLISAAKQPALELLSLLDALCGSILYIPTRSAAQPGDEEFLPQLIPDSDYHSVVTFSSPSRCPANLPHGGYVLQVPGLECLQLLPPSYGLALNPGFSAELNIPARSIRDYCQARKISRPPGWQIVVDPHDELETLCRKVLFASAKRQWAELHSIMQSILVKENRLTLLAHLLARAPGSSVDKLLLCGLPDWLSLNDSELRELYARCGGHDIAIYNLTAFLLTYGCATKALLQKLCENFSEIEQIEQFRPALERQGPSSPQAESWRQMVYADYGISMENAAALRARFSS